MTMFLYRATFRTGQEEPAAGLIAEEPTNGPFRAVVWNHRARAWTFNPEAAASFLLDDRNFDRWTEVDRTKAEEIARTFGTELPTEEELHRMCEEGDRTR
jgi:hypothetical protein